MTIAIIAFFAIAASFVAGAIYGRKAEAAAAAEVKKIEDEIKKAL